MLLTFLMVACDSSSTKKKPDEKANNPLEGHVKALKKAQQAEKKILQAAEKQRQAIEKATQNKKPDKP